MKKELFEELLESVKQGGAIMKGFHPEALPDLRDNGDRAVGQ